MYLHIKGDAYALAARTLRLSYTSDEKTHPAIKFPPNHASDALLNGNFQPRTLQELNSLGSHISQKLSNDNKLGFVGIFCRSHDFLARHTIRQTTMQIALALGAQAICVRFIICQPHSLPLDPGLWDEMQGYQDIHVVDCTENMDEGKSFEYFATIQDAFPRFQFYCKTDIDSYILFHNLAMALSQAQAYMFYGGRRSGWDYMSGSLYVLSSDLVELLRLCRTLELDPCKNITGFEDLVIGRLLHEMTSVPPRNSSLTNGEDTLRLQEWSPAHSVLLDRDPWPGLQALHPNHILIHDVKNLSKWWEIHMHYTGSLTETEISLAQNETFFE